MSMSRYAFPIAVVLSLVVAPDALAQDRGFSGFYTGLEVGSQHIVAGSFVDGVDVLAEDDRVVTSLVIGGRYEFDARVAGIVVGGEVTYGWLDGDLNLSDPSTALDISYRTSHQTSIGGILGVSFGAPRNWLGYGYVSEATREFSVAIQLAGTDIAQRDEQGMLRYGIGIERHFSNGVNVRVSLGKGRADFGDQRTNIDPDQPLELAAGVLYQF